MSIEVIVLKGISFNKQAVLKMKKSHFMNCYNDEDLWDQVQALKPKPRQKKKKA